MSLAQSRFPEGNWTVQGVGSYTLCEVLHRTNIAMIYERYQDAIYDTRYPTQYLYRYQGDLAGANPSPTE